jgi:hypothetical protein
LPASKVKHMLEVMKSVLMARGPLALCVALCLLICPSVAAAQPAESDAVAPTAAPVTAAPAEQPSGVQQATDQERTEEELEADRTANETDPTALTEFRPALDPYGVWVQHPTWGLVWVPNSSVVGPQFVPYVSYGHWALSESGEWIWVSELPFGWVVFHYGRWVSIPAVGWAWIPGRRYAPAWVRWRVADPDYAYIGWGPLPPSWIWVDGTAAVLWRPPPTVYVFCPSYYAFHPHPYVYLVRDPVLVRRLGHHTHRYTPPRHGQRGSRHSGPSMAEARIPSDAVPRHRVASSARFTGPDARHRIGERDVRRSRTAAEPTPARVSSGRSGTFARTLGSGRSGRSRTPADPRSTPNRAEASRTGPVRGRTERVGVRAEKGRTSGRPTRGYGPGRGFVPRGLPSTVTRRRR